VSVERGPGGRWALLRDGRPHEVRGAGTDGGRLPLLAALGATSFRTWGVGPDTEAQLDEAEELGMSVTLGLWLGRRAHRFDWHDREHVARQRRAVRDAVLAHRDHPALLMWGIGNEMEQGNDDPVMWEEIGALVRMVQRLDRHHPTMVVTAELGEANAERLQRYVPEVDVWGINSYGRIASLSERLDAVGYDGPFVVTELGHPAEWETPKTAWGTPREVSSSAKIAGYRASFSAIARDPRCLGAYAFVWSRGVTPVDTWHALLGPGDVRFAPTDALFEAWVGLPPANRSPSVRALHAPFDGAEVAPGAPIRARFDARDPEGEALRYAWILHRDSPEPLRRGAGAVHTCHDAEGADLAGRAEFVGAAPQTPGAWRLLGFAIDPGGRAAYASARFRVAGAAPEGPVFPFWVDDVFAPSGFMGDASERVTETRCPPRPGFCQGRCRKFTYHGARRGEHGWAGVAWMHPQGNWRGRFPGVPVPPGAEAVELVAWGARGGERVLFSAGRGDVDGFEQTLRVELTTEPTTYRIRLDAGVRDEVVFGFGWRADDPGRAPLTFHVADVRWVGGSAPAGYYGAPGP
ncbi:MAG: glycoside hydrolase family 2 TIM barrel-domain containing protein, partial [Myxococcota bacterium]